MAGVGGFLRDRQRSGLHQDAGADPILPGDVVKAAAAATPRPARGGWSVIRPVFRTPATARDPLSRNAGHASGLRIRQLRSRPGMTIQRVSTMKSVYSPVSPLSGLSETISDEPGVI